MVVMTKVSTVEQIASLQHWLHNAGPVIVAVSGGVDSLTLGILAARTLGKQTTLFHALSPAVPAASTARVWRVGNAEAWRLRMIDAGEFRDQAYLDNPYRRCYHCKSRLYATLAMRGDGIILSGTNTDDLGDFRPGLQAAGEHGVRHPFVECNVNKDSIRHICRELGHPAIADLPASPCLSSRVETGLRIEPRTLGFIDRVERILLADLKPSVVRCRVLHDAIAVQLDNSSLSQLQTTETEDWRHHISSLAAPLGLPRTIRFEPYRMGSAFVESP